MKLWEFYSLDIWGNKKDGYEINNIFNMGLYVLSEEFPPFDILVKILKKENILKKRYRYASQCLYDEFDIIEYRGKPLLQVSNSHYEFDDIKDSRWITNFPNTRYSIVYAYNGKRLWKKS
jgi:hypothetical protein